MADHSYFSYGWEDNPDPGSWQVLPDHLHNVALMAAEFAAAFQAGPWGHLAGLWHDLGKYHDAFQENILKDEPALEHSAWGAIWAKKIFNDDNLALPLSFAIAGHHTGLPNLRESNDPHHPSLVEHLRAHSHNFPDLLTRIPPELLHQPLPELPDHLRTGVGLTGNDFMKVRRALEFWTRFLFSSLVDADRLDREIFLTGPPEQDSPRAVTRELQLRLAEYVDGLPAGLSVQDRQSPTQLIRRKVLSACREAARQSPGFFNLTVPSGWGKTVACLTMALDHALAHGLDRVVVVTPHIGLPEQTVQTCREACGAANVLEHYTDFAPPDGSVGLAQEIVRRRDLAAENWDLPIIVTDTVQFFESLYASQAYRCRKLHNLAGSVIILDQVHALPHGSLTCVIDALQELVHNYGCSVLLSTSSPSALVASRVFPEGLTELRHIVIDADPGPEDLPQPEYSWPDSDLDGPTWSELAEELVSHDQVLAVVPRRGDARLLARLLKEISARDSVWHLSGLMCPAHRLEILNQVRAALHQGAPCRLVATTRVAAGSDLDFPMLFLALDGLASMVQAGGLCNRSGHHGQGQVKVFLAPSRPPRGVQAKAFEVARALLQANNGQLNLNDSELFESYYRTLYYNEEQDICAIQPQRQEFNFASVSRDFKLIEDGFTRTVVVPYGQAPELLQTLASQGPSRLVFRQLQPYCVQVHEHTFSQILEAGAILELTPGLFSISPAFEYIYDRSFGLAAADDPRDHPDTLIA